MTAPATVRPAVPDDADGIPEVHIRTWQETYAHLLSAAYLEGLDVAARAEQWRGSLSDSAGAPVFVALDGDRIVGFALAGPARDEDPPRPFQLYAINVVASAHGTGAGQALFDAAVGDSPAYLWAADDNPRAEAFYRRNGFARDGGVSRQMYQGAEMVTVRMVR
ncbi:GNAT family N-acetyltransferase [Clavibacter michiganensis]|uniref:Acetyltransferase n=1 Tax=Clavibacter michiganensis subsp. insidiosus TaxID=33014 RepID=A0A0D5CIY6_9MICO|nr:GNAT family N-acetyltransferase [Clavibacter michiganensis]AJW79255.1 acetyltransferase [Clavibacter michiganensis subsp. insidiosus]AWF98019.1 acetyltransferase [Clavibacter michiganensis subsp. insidiosus]AWG01782.1 acetyltransferase [Clavibacter michiganensis subsp. insidiosus]OQJ59707.1 N-acetyltransferase [Clavibacter michiganensis subsp. insidiosus]RII87873.1 GNAT family N-acetyltransferase [Clavibacter michiganensis subsp. insidiosus]